MLTSQRNSTLKVLLVSPDYPQTFWSFNRVLRMTGKKTLSPPLGLITVAALLPNDWQLELIDMAFQSISEKQWRDCDLVFLSGMAVQAHGILQVIEEAKKRGKTVVVGGPWVFHYPEDALTAGADIVVRGEAETTIDQLLAALAEGRSGIVIHSQEKADLAQSPVPRFDLLDIQSYANMAVQFSRGCPFQCEFCDITLMLGRRVRNKTPEQILAELQSLYDLGWRRWVFLVDDNFIGNITMAKALLKKLIPWMEERKRPFGFYTQASVNMGSDKQLLDQMYKAGFFRVFLGIETPDEESLIGAKKFQNVHADLDKVCLEITKAGFQIIAGAIIGFDNEKPGAGNRLVEFARRNHIPELFTSLLQVGPCTDLCNRMEREKRLLTLDYQYLSNQTGLINFVPTRPISEIVEEYIYVYRTLYEPKEFIKRAYECFALMDPPKIKKPFQLPYLLELRAVAITILRQGLLYPSRNTFWKYFFKALWNFPARFDRYITACVEAEHYFDFRETIYREIQSQMRDMDEETKSRCFATEPLSPVSGSVAS
ncbi:MAG: hypothetical protein QG577_1171 [Thermodesulfobacteriota bacterium]|nr:hypothetical protein [Thermodesulfobacteriota bacterium]